MKIMVIGSSALDEAVLAAALRRAGHQAEIVAAERVLIVETLHTPVEYLIRNTPVKHEVTYHGEYGERRNKSDRKRDRGSRWR